MRITVEDTWGPLAVLWMVGLGIPYILAQMVVLNVAKSVCLEHGWPDAKVDYAFNRYCVKRVDQTDVVVPLREVDK